MLIFLRNFPWKQTPLVILGLLVSLIVVPFIEEKQSRRGRA